MTATSQQLQEWMTAQENEHLEFKEAKANFHFEKLVKYCAALANEGGGSIVLGVTDKRPRRVVGSAAFAELERTKAGLIGKLKLRIEAEEIAHPDGRVLVFTAPGAADRGSGRRRGGLLDAGRGRAGPDDARHAAPDFR